MNEINKSIKVVKYQLHILSTLVWERGGRVFIPVTEIPNVNNPRNIDGSLLDLNSNWNQILDTFYSNYYDNQECN